MVVLTLTPHRGNSARSFPYTGYLGLTPVTLAGVVRTKIEEDGQPIEASSVIARVRCYESMGSGSTLATPNSSGSSSASQSEESASTSLTPPLLARLPDESLKGNFNGKACVLWEHSVEVWAPPNAAAASLMVGQEHKSTHPSQRPSSCSQFADLGDFEQNWRLVVPPEALAQGAKSTMIFKTWRIWWAVEAGTLRLEGTRQIGLVHKLSMNGLQSSVTEGLAFTVIA